MYNRVMKFTRPPKNRTNCPGSKKKHLPQARAPIGIPSTTEYVRSTQCYLIVFDSQARQSNGRLKFQKDCSQYCGAIGTGGKLSNVNKDLMHINPPSLR